MNEKAKEELRELIKDTIIAFVTMVVYLFYIVFKDIGDSFKRSFDNGRPKKKKERNIKKSGGKNYGTMRKIVYLFYIVIKYIGDSFKRSFGTMQKIVYLFKRSFDNVRPSKKKKERNIKKLGGKNYGTMRKMR
jgi:hypothetical protein